MIRSILSLAAATAFTAIVSLHAQAGQGKGCLTQKCHAVMLDHKYVHGPTAVGDCLLCHKKTGEHSFRLAADRKELCYLCHENEGTVRGIDCVACHDPHGTDLEFHLKKGAGTRCRK